MMIVANGPFRRIFWDALGAAIALVVIQTTALAEAPSPTPSIATPSPYTLPWQLRSVMVGNVLRVDSAVAFYNDKAGNSGGTAAATMMTGTYKLAPNFAGLMRFGFVNNSPPTRAPGATSFINPVLGGTYATELSNDFRLSVFLGATVPIGMGGGNTPDPSVQAANSAGILARSAMDNAMFAPNYLTIIPGVDFAYIANGLTAQLEATFFQLNRVRGENVDKDPERTNFTSGLGLGYAVTSQLSVATELRYQRWLNNQTVAATANPATQNLSIGIGPRLNLKYGSTVIRPGIAYTNGLMGPMGSGGYTFPTNSDKIITVDIPVSF